MPRQTKTAYEIWEAIHQVLYKDRSLDGQLAEIPYITVVGLPPGQPAGSANWDLSACSSPPAIQRAKAALQKDLDLALPHLGSSAHN